MSRDRLASFIEHVEDDASLQEFVLLHAGDGGSRLDGKPSENEDELRTRLSHYAGTAIKQLTLSRSRALSSSPRRCHLKGPSFSVAR